MSDPKYTGFVVSPLARCAVRANTPVSMLSRIWRKPTSALIASADSSTVGRSRRPGSDSSRPSPHSPSAPIAINALDSRPNTPPSASRGAPENNAATRIQTASMQAATAARSRPRARRTSATTPGGVASNSSTMRGV